jgi:hypothetical protein
MATWWWMQMELSVKSGADMVGTASSSRVGKSSDSSLCGWRELETKLLTGHAPSLQKAGEKTWNVYSVFFSSAGTDQTQLREIRWIEEDLERTRKIAACGLTSREDIVTALLPLLPIQRQPLLDSEDFDITQRLKKRIASIAPDAANAVLDKTVTPAEVVRLLGA